MKTGPDHVALGCPGWQRDDMGLECGHGAHLGGMYPPTRRNLSIIRDHGGQKEKGGVIVTSASQTNYFTYYAHSRGTSHLSPTWGSKGEAEVYVSLFVRVVAQ